MKVRPILFFALMFAIVQHAWGQKYSIVGPGSCGVGTGNCHARENNWYKGDAHKGSLGALDESENSERYALAVGLTAANFRNSGSLCMDCHGTPITERRGKEVEDGVSCEGCHGPGSGYRESHKETKGVFDVGQGMVDLRNMDARAAACVRCHYTNIDALSAAGHPDGKKFPYTSKIKQIADENHWKHPLSDQDKDRKPYDKAVAAKAPGGNVKISAPPPPKAVVKSLPTVAQPSNASAQMDQTPARIQDEQPQPRKRLPPPLPTPPAVDPVSIPASVGPVDLPPFPIITDSTRVDTLLLLLKQRLELLYQKTR